ncbi:MAG: PLDc N-terminal domain-containing protein [Actinomycetes bacterium]
MLRVLPVIIALAMIVYAIVDCLQSDPRAVRNLPRLGWLALIVFIPLFGAMAWFLSGRPRRPRPAGPAGPSRRGPIGPDDDPDFLGDIRPDS